VQRPGATGITAPEPLTKAHLVERFDCGKAALNDWLKFRAIKNEGRSSRCFVICENNAALGYYVLATGAVTHDNAPRALKANLPNPTPVMVLGRLAVDKDYQRRGIGSDLLQDALKRALQASRSVGAMAVIVQAKDDDAIPFYASFGVRTFGNDRRKLFITMAEIAAAL
jgi:GNAT superfamily N-acetyltransferase